MEIILNEKNQERFEKISEILKKDNKAILIQPVGTGQSDIALKIAGENKGKRILYIFRSADRLDVVKEKYKKNISVNEQEIEFVTNKKLLRTASENPEKLNDIDFIIYDEVKTISGDEISKLIKQLINRNPDIKLLGLELADMELTRKDERDVVYDFFDKKENFVIGRLEDEISSGVYKDKKYIATFSKFDEDILELEAEAKRHPEYAETIKKRIEMLQNISKESEERLPLDFEKYITNKSGRYVIYCENIEKMRENISEASKLFEKVNPNMQIYTLPGRNFTTQMKNSIESFYLNDDPNTLKLMFVSDEERHGHRFTNLDGVIRMRNIYSRYIYQRQLANAYKNCKQDGVVIDVIRRLEHLKIMSNFKIGLEELMLKKKQSGIDEKFKLSDSSKKHENLMNVRKTNYQKRLRTIKAIKKETGRELSGDTKIDGVSYKSWKGNLLTRYRKGKVQMDDDLLEEYKKEGILRERERRVKKTDQEKFDILVKYKKEHPDEDISGSTIDENGDEIGKDRQYLQVAYNRGEVDLTEEQIKQLKDLGILNLSDKEKGKTAGEYGISKTLVKIISDKFENVDNFIKVYKKGETNFEHRALTGKIKSKAIILSQKPLTPEQRQAYINFAELIYGQKDILSENGKFIVAEEIDEIIENMYGREKDIILSITGLCGNKPETLQVIGDRNGLTRERVRQILRNIIAPEIKAKKPVKTIDELYLEQRRLGQEDKMSNLEFLEYRLRNTKTSQLSLPNRAKNAFEKSGHTTLDKVRKLGEFGLSKIRGIGSKVALETLEVLYDYEDEILEYKKSGKIKQDLLKIEAQIKGYNKAYNYFMEEEDIFDLDAITPAFLEEEKSLSQKIKQKASKKHELDTIEGQIENQDKKSKKIKEALDTLGIPSEEKDKKLDE